MKKILGLDLGTNSIGWAVVDAEQKKILGTGVRIFPEGVENLGQGQKERSKNASRREYRQTRRQYFRKRLRKAKLLELLIKHNMCPLTEEELRPWKYYNKSEGKSGVKFPSAKAFNKWLAMNPYQLRAEGLERDLTKEEFGRALYHLIQRRGFWSNRKTKDDGSLSKGKDNVVGLKETKEKLEDFPTLGSFLYQISYKNGKKFRRITNEEGKDLRVRARYTLRQMYINEFEKLWERQANHLKLNKVTESVKKVYHIGNPYRKGVKENGLKKKLTHRLEYLKNKGIKAEFDNKTDPKNSKLIVEKKVHLKELLGGGDIIKQEESVLFYQRPLRNQKFLLDECSFEKTIWKYNGALFYQRKKPYEDAEIIYTGKKPCPISHPLFEIRRAYEFINNIEYGDRVGLNEKQRKKVLDLINSRDGNFDFEKIPKELNLQHEKFNYDDKHKVPGNYTHTHVKPIFSEEIWEEHFEDIWHCFYFYSDHEELVKRLHKDFGLKENDFDKVRGTVQDDGARKGGIILKDGHANLSLKAIKNILPFLEKGYRYSDAVLLGGVKNIFGKRWKDFTSRHEELEKEIITINKDPNNKEGEAIKKIKEYLENDFGFEPGDKAFYGLYHHSQDTEKQELKEELDEPDNLRNPLVQKALYELKGVVKALSGEYLKNGERFAQIKIETARDLKQSRQRRIDQWNENQQRQKENDKARAVLDEFGLSHSRSNIHKYLLWKELQDEKGIAVCPYTGNTINIADLFNDNKFQIEHIIPYSKSLDDSFANKTICEAEENGRKGEKTPYEFYGKGGKKWGEIAERAFRVLPYQKAKRFTSKTAHETDFIARQLNDTRYISKAAGDYLKQICPNVLVFPGQLTSDLRRKWGLDSILNPPIEVNSEGGIGRVWAQLDEKGEAVAFYPVFNKPPKYEKGEFVITGEMKKGTFESKYLTLKFEADGYPDGKYWAKIKANNEPVKLTHILRPKPETAANEILLYGKTDKKGKYNTKFLSQKLEGRELRKDTAYWARLTVQPDKTQFFNIANKKIPKPKKNNVLLYGKVKEGQFLSSIYTCMANVEDGKYNALLEVGLESITFHRIKNDEPEAGEKQIKVVGNVKDGKFQPNIAHRNFYDALKASDGLHWALFEIKSEPHDFTIVENPQPRIDGDKLIEGTIALDNILDVDKKTGEVLHEDEKKYFFSGKERDDHRHHAVDALVVAMTEQDYLWRLSTYNANKEEKKRGNRYDTNELNFPMPWDGFREEAKTHIENILVSHKKVSRVLTKKKTKDPKTGRVSEGLGVRGRIHKENVFGKRQAPKKEEAYHRRTSLADIKNNKHIGKIVDDGIQKLIKRHLESNYPERDFTGDFNVPADAFFMTDKNGIKQPRIFLPNKNGEPVPIKKVRIRENIGGLERLKEINQYVNPRNNHHVLIYKDHDGNLKENVVTFWTAVEREKQGLPLFQLPDDGAEIVTTLQINDMFLFAGLAKDDINWEKADCKILSEYLYKVEAVSSKYYEFRHHLEATQKREYPPFYRRIQSFGNGVTGWKRFNPIKVCLTHTGQIKPVWKKQICQGIVE